MTYELKYINGRTFCGESDRQNLMSVFFLVTLGVSWRKTFNFLFSGPEYQVATFGFRENAIFNIDVQTKNDSRMNLFLVKEAEMPPIKPQGTINFQNVCEESPPHISVINFTTSESSKRVEWNGTITEQGVYLVLAVNCMNPTGVMISLNFQNPDSFLDYREKYTSLVYFALACVYIIISLIWIINGLLHPEFMIPLHTAATFMVITKAFYDGMEAKRWELEHIGDSLSRSQQRISKILCITHYTLFWSLPILIFCGWCTYNKVGRYAISAISSSFLMTISFMLTFSNDAFVDVVILFMALAIVWYGNEVGTSLVLFIDVSNQTELYDGVRSKLQLVTGFLKGTMITVFLSISSCFVLDAAKCWPIAEEVSFEFAGLAIVVIEMRYFLLRREYTGEEKAEECNTEITMRMLEDPKGSEIVAVSNDL